MTIKTIVHTQRGAHLTARTQNTPANYWTYPVRLVLEAETGHESANEGEEGGNTARWKSHFGLADAVIAPSVEIGDSVCYWATQVCANEGADEGGEEDKALLRRGEEVRSIQVLVTYRAELFRLIRDSRRCE